MRLVLTLLLLLAAAALVIYAHWQLARQVAPLPRRCLGHALVLLVAGTFAWVVASVYMGAEEGGELPAFITAFGVAHLPPAIVLFLKQQQGQ